MVTRIDLATSMTAWSKSYAYSGSSTEYVAALSIKPDLSGMAVVLSEIGGTNEHKVFIVRLEDGTLTSPVAVFNHGNEGTASTHIVNPQALFYDSYYRILVLFNPVTTRSDNKGGKLAFGMIDDRDFSITRYMEQ